MLRILRYLAFLSLALAVIGAGAAYLVFLHYSRDLPDYQALASYDPPMVTRVHAGDGRLLAEYAVENRVFVPISAIPKRVIDAFLSAEDKNFYNHPGVDLQGIARAAVQNALNFGSNRRPVGASTITQQVAKNFLLTNEVSFERKIKEALLAYRIEQAFSKDRILELYLNEIYLGFGSYGVASAALNYFNRSLDELTLAEAAFIAALPKAPNNYNPQRRPEAAKGRRDYVLERMAEDGVASRADVDAAIASPIVIRSRSEAEAVRADVFAEEVRRDLMRRYGEKTV
ncbi:MAG: transglycosylase domain-containing protein, partial [Alphaproteobacteria bacterium]